MTTQFIPTTGLIAAAAHCGAVATSCSLARYAMGQIARRCDALVSRQRRQYSPSRAATIAALRGEYAALRAAE